ncbi:hypothetical protein [Maricaulis sp.]|uniref:hypothetical protein n=1 Tax=Maricaulis sp. TaxID=1486257 RepID=UPI003297BF9B
MWPFRRTPRLIELDDIPECDFGAPYPMLAALEGGVSLVYLMPDTDPDWDGEEARLIGFDTADLPVAAIRFVRPHTHKAGPPDEETLAGHPLASRGLYPCGAFEVRRSDWIDALRQADSIRPSHSDERFRKLRHFIFTFRESTVEVAADGYEVALLGPLSIREALQLEAGRLAR